MGGHIWEIILERRGKKVILYACVILQESKLVYHRGSKKYASTIAPFGCRSENKRKKY